MQLIDITRELMRAPVYPGDPAPELTKLSNMSAGDACNTTAITACLHNGTHMDAPRHFFMMGDAIDKVPLEACIGECIVVECNGLLLGDTAEELLPQLRRKQRVLFKGDVQLTPSAAFVLSGAGLVLIGVEGPSVAPPTYAEEVHRQLLSSDIVLLEGLDLSKAEAGVPYLLMAAPLRIAGADGAPVRAVLAESQRIDWDENTWR
ncbi:MAG: cyclase family protein [Clostridia bacterium]|nr:cyclase family protein [Clostridia bacterium]